MRGFIDTLNFVGTIVINDTVAASMTTSAQITFCSDNFYRGVEVFEDRPILKSGEF